MKKLLTVGAVVSLVAGMILIQGDAAFAARHRHRRNHRHNNLHCGAGTHRSGNQCVPDQTTSPGGGGGGGGSGSPGPTTTFFGCTAGNVTLSPCTVSLARTGATTGSFSGTFTASGLPSATPFFVTPFGGGACPMTGGGGPFVSGTGFGFGGGSSITFTLANAGNCTPGTYPITITEAVAPNAVFTGFLTAQLF